MHQKAPSAHAHQRRSFPLDSQWQWQLATLKEDIESLRIEVKQGASGSVQQEAKLRDLTQARDDLMRERDSKKVDTWK